MTPYLLFGLNGVRYAVDARSVLEIVRLPELTLADEAPPHIAGVINLRGKIAPVMNLDLRLGHSLRRYQLSDSVILLQADELVIGVIVNEVTDVAEISAAALEPVTRYDGETSAQARFLAGNAKVDEEIVMLLDVPRLIHAPALPESGDSAKPAGQSYFCPEATAEEREVFHSRAHNLMQTVDSLEDGERVPLSIIQLGGERFGVGLDVVREFSHLRRVTQIPCCPPHIVGNMNLRGDILTLADIRSLLNIPASSAAAEVMVVESGDLHIGVPVDQVLEVIYLRPADIAPMPAASQEEKDEYCKGMARYGEGMVSILDMQKILAKGGIEVEEEV
jgi:purine-binding chemotaxis protein CheW